MHLLLRRRCAPAREAQNSPLTLAREVGVSVISHYARVLSQNLHPAFIVLVTDFSGQDIMNRVRWSLSYGSSLRE